MSDKVLDFVTKRKENIEQKRRNFERILFQNFLGAYSVIDSNGTIYPVKLIDISKEGCLFQVPWDFKKDKKFEKGYEIQMRMYFTNKSYIPVAVAVKYANEHIEDDGTTHVQYGCEFDTSYHSYAALKSFIDFLYEFAEHSVIDKGDPKSYFA